MPTVFTGGTVIVDPNPGGDPILSDALAVDDGIVIATGADAAAMLSDAASTAASAQHIDLAGGTLAAAPGDGHCHPIFGALEATGPAIRETTDLQGILDAVAAWKREHPDDEWIIGGSYDATFAPGGRFDARLLDEVTGDTPTVLRCWDYHTVWANSAALAAGGITADTPDPEFGRIVRRADGSPLGTLQEAAANNFLRDVVPARGRDAQVDAIARATRSYAEQGTAWIQDAWVEPDDYEAYLAAAEADALHCRVNLAFRADPSTWHEQLPVFVEQRERVRALGHPRLTAETVKFFIDGVIENHTAALIAPYADDPTEHGLPNWTDEKLQSATAAFDARGFQLHLHAIGDGANRAALDALERIQSSEIDTERPRAHVIAHVAMLHPEDVARFADLGVIANFEPYWAQCDAVMRDLTIPHIGHDRESWQYLIGSLVRSGAPISFGSDWPVTTKDWRPALATAITRRSSATPDDAAWLPEERIDAATAYAAYTTGIAKQAGTQTRGTLAVGHAADMVWLSDNPLDIDPDRIPDITVHATWVAGTLTHHS